MYRERLDHVNGHGNAVAAIQVLTDRLFIRWASWAASLPCVPVPSSQRSSPRIDADCCYLATAQVVPAFDNAHTDVSDVEALLANTSLEDEFVGVRDEDRAQAVRRWLAAEDDVGAMDGTVDMVLSWEDDREWAAHLFLCSLSGRSRPTSVSGPPSPDPCRSDLVDAVKRAPPAKGERKSSNCI